MQYSSLLALLAAILLVIPTAAKTQCSPKVVALATGIHLNIEGQHGESCLSTLFFRSVCVERVCTEIAIPSLTITLKAELSAVKKLQKIEAKAQGKGYSSKFELAKGELLSDIAAGITIRKFNQQVLPKGNEATAGLKKYASAQLTEQKLAESLTGVSKHDKHILATLVGDIKNGTALNERNLAAVSAFVDPSCDWFL